MNIKKVIGLTALLILILFLYLMMTQTPLFEETSTVDATRPVWAVNKLSEEPTTVDEAAVRAANKLSEEPTTVDEAAVRAAKTISKESKRVLVTLVNNAYLSFTYSWLCNTKHMKGVHKSVLIITTDKVSKETLERDWPGISVVALDLGTLGGDQRFSQAGYIKLMIKRTQLSLSILLADIEIFLFEVDCVWLGNPIPDLEKYNDVDIIVNPVTTQLGLYAGGFLYLYPTDKGKALWKKVTEKMVALGMKVATLRDNKAIPMVENDQNCLSNPVVERYGGVRVKVLPLETYADGKWYSLSEKQRNKTHPIIIVNNNWVAGNKRKIKRAKKWHHWFIKKNKRPRGKWKCDMDLVYKTVY